MKKYLLIVVFIFSMFAVFPPSYAMGQFFMMGHPLQGKKAPDFNLKTAKGNTIRFSEYRNGSSAILFFWATWCPHCRRQLPGLEAVSRAMEEKGIKLILIDIEEDAAQVNAYLNKAKVGMDVVLDEKAEAAEEYGILGVPSYYFINKDGVVKAVEHELPENYEAILAGK